MTKCELTQSFDLIELTQVEQAVVLDSKALWAPALYHTSLQKFWNSVNSELTAYIVRLLENCSYRETRRNLQCEIHKLFTSARWRLSIRRL